MTPRPKRAARTAFRPQFQTTECAVAVLAIMLAHFGRTVATHELRRVSGVTRDCLTAAGLRRAAGRFGLACRARRAEPADLAGLRLPVVVHLHFIHFVVLEAVTADGFRVNCPAAGRLDFPAEAFDESFTGIVLEFEPTPDFVPSVPARGRIAELLFDLGRRHAGRAAAIVATGLAETTAVIAGAGALASGAAVTAVVALVAAAVAAIGRHLASERAARAIRADLLDGVTAHLAALPGGFYRYRVPAMVRGVVESCGPIADLLVLRFGRAGIDALAIGVLLVAVVVIDRPAGLAVVAVTSVAAGAAAVLTVHRRDVERHAGIGTGGLVSILFAACRRPELARFGRDAGLFRLAAVGAAAQTAAARLRIGSGPAALQALPSFLAVAASGAVLLASGGRGGGASAAVLLVAVAVARHFVGLVGLRGAEQDLGTRLHGLADVLDEPTAPGAPTAGGEIVDGSVRLAGVRFGYAETRPAVVSDISFSVESGAVVGLCGPSGAGKSTIRALVDGTLVASAGEVRIGGRAIGDWRRQDLARHLASVGRAGFFFEGTIRDNLTLFDRSIGDDALRAALADAAAAFVFARAGGLDAPVAGQGETFSGGQLQRLLLARALARDPRILILDEGLEAVDTETERRIFAALRRRGVTVLVIGQRPATLAVCDRVLTCVGGRLVEASEAGGDGRSAAAVSAAVPFLGPPGGQTEGAEDASTAPATEGLPSSGDGVLLRAVRLLDRGWRRHARHRLIAFRVDDGSAVEIAPGGYEPGSASTRERAACAAPSGVATATGAPELRLHGHECMPLPRAPGATLGQWFGLCLGASRGTLALATGARLLALAAVVAGLGAIVFGAAAGETIVGAFAPALLAGAAALVAWGAAERCGDRLSAEVESRTALVAAALASTVDPARLRLVPVADLGAGLASLVAEPKRLREAVARLPAAVLGAVAGFVGAVVLAPDAAVVVAAAALLPTLPLASAVVAARQGGAEIEASERARRFCTGVFIDAEALRVSGRLGALLARWRDLDDRARRIMVDRRRLLGLAAAPRFYAALGLGVALTAGAPAALACFLLAGLCLGEIEGRLVDHILATEGRLRARRLLALPRESGTAVVDAGRASLGLAAVTHVYPGATAPVLRDIDVAIDPRAFTVLSGPSGAGKSTLLHLLLGVLRPSDGLRRLGDLTADAVDPAAWRRSVGVILQGQDLETVATVQAQVCGHEAIASAAVWRALAVVELDREVAGWPMGLQTIVEAGTLAAGQQQRLLIARALVRGPVLLAMDEAINAIDDAMQARILARLRDRGTGLLVVSHRAGVARLADREIRIEGGRIVADRRTERGGGTPMPPVGEAPPLPAASASPSVPRRHPFRDAAIARYERPVSASTVLMAPGLPWHLWSVALGLLALAALV